MGSFYVRRLIGAGSLAVLAAAFVTAALGTWQLQRAAEKAAWQQARDAAAAAPAVGLGGDAPPPSPAAVDGRRVRLAGVYDAAHSVFLDNRTHDGVAGFHVLTPLRLAGDTRSVLVLRGWIARDPMERTRLPSLATPAGEVRVDGLASTDLAQPMLLGRDAEPGPRDQIWQHVTFERFARWSGLAMFPIYVRQIAAPDAPDGLSRDWAQPGTSVTRHQAYAAQWFTMCAALVVVWIVMMRRGGRPAAGGERSGSDE